MTMKDKERALLELERQYWQAIMDHDVDGALQLTDDPCIVAGAEGIGSFDKQAMTAMMQERRYELKRFELGGDTAVRFLKDDVAIVAYKVHEELTVDGKSVTLDAADASTWVFKGGRWVCAMHTEAVAGDAFGRADRATRRPT